jgi:hypothetical protein
MTRVRLWRRRALPLAFTSSLRASPGILGIARPCTDHGSGSLKQTRNEMFSVGFLDTYWCAGGDRRVSGVPLSSARGRRRKDKEANWKAISRAFAFCSRFGQAGRHQPSFMSSPSSVRCRIVGTCLPFASACVKPSPAELEEE